MALCTIQVSLDGSGSHQVLTVLVLHSAEACFQPVLGVMPCIVSPICPFSMLKYRSNIVYVPFTIKVENLVVVLK